MSGNRGGDLIDRATDAGQMLLIFNLSTETQTFLIDIKVLRPFSDI